jgi:TolB-like protein
LTGAAGALALAALATWFVTAGQGALSGRRPRLTVEPLRGSSGSAAVADALTDELISDLVARYGNLVTVTTRSPSSSPGEGESTAGGSHHLMRGTVLPLGTGFRSTVWLEAMPSRRQVWTAVCDLGDEPQDRARCARRLVDDLAGRLELTSTTAE